MEAVGGSCDCAFSSSSFNAAIHLGSDRVIFTRSGRSSLEPVWCLPSPFCPAGVPAAVGVETATFQLLFVEKCLSRKYLGSSALIRWLGSKSSASCSIPGYNLVSVKLPCDISLKSDHNWLFPVLFSSVLFYFSQFLKDFFWSILNQENACWVISFWGLVPG